MKKYKNYFLFLFIASLTILLAPIPDIISDELKVWSKSIFGFSYPIYFLCFFIIGTIVLLYLTEDFSKDSTQKSDQVNDVFSPFDSLRIYLLKMYKKKLNQKLSGREAINIKIKLSNVGTSEITTSAFVPISDINNVEKGFFFNESNGRLLVVGDPGSGKSTYVLQLVLYIIESNDKALPIILNLSTWKRDYKKIENWLQEILQIELEVKTNLIEKLINYEQLIIVFDGLDEINRVDYQESFLDALSIYSMKPFRKYVLTSRIEEYKSINRDANVMLQVEICSFTHNQIMNELKSIGYKQPEAAILLQSLKRDEVLLKASLIPIYFNILQVLFASGKKIFLSNTIRQRHEEIIDMFCKFSINNCSSLKYSPVKIEYWLSFLAKQMDEKNINEFELSDIDNDWYDNWSNLELIFIYICFFAANITIGFLFTCIILVYTPISYMFYTFVITTTLFVIIMFYFTLTGIVNKNVPHIETFIKINWSINDFTELYKNNKSKYLLFFMFFLSIFQFVIFDNIKPIISLIFSYFIITIISKLAFGSEKILKIKKPYERFFKSIKSLHFSIIQHFCLRYMLYRKGLIPWLLVDFLNEMVALNLFESNDGKWKFRHKIIQDYFLLKAKKMNI